ncbi:MAG: transporter [Firmicutes bacterium]|nr:transporter [Bacillota bacterium]
MAGVNICGLAKIYYIKGAPISALADVDLDISDGSFVTVVGKSGCGKSTLLRLICGLEPMTAGEILFNTEGEFHSRVGARVNMVFQEPRLMPWLTVEQNMAVALIREKDTQKSKATVNQFLDMMGLKKFKDAYPSQISGGMAQRVALGRMLCYNPDLILMDEPFGALDAFTRRNLQKLLIDIFREQKKTIIFVTHDVDEAIFLGQKVVIIENGRISRQVLVNLPYPREIASHAFFQLREDVMATIMHEENINIERKFL